MNNRNFVTGLGWEGRWEYHIKTYPTSTNVYLTANRQWLKKTHDVRFREVSLQGNYGIWPVETPSYTYAAGGISFSSRLHKHAIINFAYQFNVGSSHLSQHFLTAGLSIPL